jgi:hypothetical protein
VISDSDAGRDPIFYRALTVVITHADPSVTSCPLEDTAISPHHLMQMAQSLGLGTRYIVYFLRRVNRDRVIREILGVPEKNDNLVTFTLGYPAT